MDQNPVLLHLPQNGTIGFNPQPFPKPYHIQEQVGGVADRPWIHFVSLGRRAQGAAASLSLKS